MKKKKEDLIDLILCLRYSNESMQADVLNYTHIKRLYELKHLLDIPDSYKI